MGDDADKFFKEMISSHHQLFRRILTLCCCFVCVALFFLYATKNQQWPRRPRPASSHQFYPSNWTLVNLKNFEFLLNSDACGTRQIDLLAIVTSHPGHVALRNAFRRALPIEALRTFNITRVFLLAQINPTQTGYHQVDQHVIEEEHINYNDIVQGDFIESYHNLSYKHVMGLKYSAHYCSQAQLILKMDDDIAVDLFQLLDLVRSKSLTGLQIAGAVLTGDERNPVRDKASKWYVSRDDYAPSKYPPFVSGWAYVTTVQAASQLVRHSESSPFFWIDDIYVTGILAALSGVNLVDIRTRFTVFVDHLKCCLRNHPITVACDYIIGPSGDDAELVEAFHRQSLRCRIDPCRTTTLEESSDKPSFCVITNIPSQTYNKMDGRIIHGQIIPLF
jgi:hypothetical protein